MLVANLRASGTKTFQFSGAVFDSLVVQAFYINTAGALFLGDDFVTIGSFTLLLRAGSENRARQRATHTSGCRIVDACRRRCLDKYREPLANAARAAVL